MDEKDITRFLAKIRVTESGCHEWMGAKNSDGYGNFMLNRRTIGSHRMAWIIAHGDIQKGLSVLHRCDNPACCNPDHLFLGSQLDNIKDRHSKGRSNALRGENHVRAKLSYDQVEEMRALYAKGGYSYQKLGALYNIGKSHAAYIVKQKIWKEKS